MDEACAGSGWTMTLSTQGTVVVVVGVVVVVVEVVVSVLLVVVVEVVVVVSVPVELPHPGRNFINKTSRKMLKQTRK